MQKYNEQVAINYAANVTFAMQFSPNDGKKNKSLAEETIIEEDESVSIIVFFI
jgi:hypothetical protein